jgi:hypothetical protein
VSDHAESRFAIPAEGLDDAVVAVAVRLVGLKGSHQLGIYTKTRAGVNGYFNWRQLGYERGELRIYGSAHLNLLRDNNFTESGAGVLINSR